MFKIFVVTTTFDDQLKCSEFAKNLLELKLCACCQVIQLQSLYNWKSEFKNETEFKLDCKTLRKDELVDYIKNNHDYDLPEIIIQEVETTQEYYNFVNVD